MLVCSSRIGGHKPRICKEPHLQVAFSGSSAATTQRVELWGKRIRHSVLKGDGSQSNFRRHYQCSSRSNEVCLKRVVRFDDDLFRHFLFDDLVSLRKSTLNELISGLCCHEEALLAKRFTLWPYFIPCCTPKLNLTVTINNCWYVLHVHTANFGIYVGGRHHAVAVFDF